MDSQEKTLSQENTEKMNVELTDNNMQAKTALPNENNAEVTTDTTETGELCLRKALKLPHWKKSI